MKKITLISAATLLFSAGAYAGGDHGPYGCNEGSLKGKYSYTVSGVNTFPAPPPGHEIPPTGGPIVTQSTHVVGQVWFDGHGHAKFTGFGSAAGFVEAKRGEGEYKVIDKCTVVGHLDFDKYHTSKFAMVLDTVDTERRPFLAYHGVVVATDTTSILPKGTIRASVSGEIFKLAGKFD